MASSNNASSSSFSNVDATQQMPVSPAAPALKRKVSTQETVDASEPAQKKTKLNPFDIMRSDAPKIERKRGPKPKPKPKAKAKESTKETPSQAFQKKKMAAIRLILTPAPGYPTPLLPKVATNSPLKPIGWHKQRCAISLGYRT